ncbi:MAG: hypothetical protein COB46_00495 [Rhodospirillaceae bacterium]|nr:MAG: hypothetical protein COB46_00495 [Rhodospirillaceae bacterium]
MEIDGYNFKVAAPPPAQPRPATQAAPADGKELKDANEQTLIEDIREKGFGAYLEDMQEQKKKDRRDKILKAMGLTEDDLANMSPEQRLLIEKIIADDIKKRVMANAAINEDDKTKLSLTTLQPNQTASAKIDTAGIGLGPLLALQEIEQNSDQITPKEEETAG